MISVPFMLLAESNVFDNGKLSVTNVFDELIVKEFPAILPDFILTFGLLGEEEDTGAELSLKIRTKAFKREEIPFKYTHRSDHIIRNVSFEVTSLPVISEETIFFEIHDRKKLISRYPLTVKREGGRG